MRGGAHGPGGAAIEKPLPPQENYAVAEAMAIKAMEHLDARRQAERLGATLVDDTGGGQAIEMAWFGRPVRVTFPAGAVSSVRGGDEIPIGERIVILHYAGSTAPVQAGTQPIGFAEVPSGSFYLDAYVRRAHKPLAAAFGRNPKRLLEAGELIGATKAAFGDASVVVHALPKVPITAVVFGADEEFGAEAKILYEPSIVSYFVTEDVAVLGGFVAQRLTRALRQLEGMGGGAP